MNRPRWCNALATWFPYGRLLPAALVLLLLMGTFTLAACRRGQEANSSPNAPPFSMDLLPPEFEAGYLAVELTGDNGQPITNAQVSLEGNMNHAGMVPVLTDPVADGDDGAVDGVYQVPFEFTMLGDWIITISASVDGNTIERNVDLSVTSEGVMLVEQ